VVFQTRTDSASVPPPRRYPALQWQLRAARRALNAVAGAGPWLRDRVGATRYANVPLAALGRDALMSIADVLMSRRLREAGHVLWAVDPALPDLGGWLCQETLADVADGPTVRSCLPSPSMQWCTPAWHHVP
jgi:hypothetical protein